MIKNLIFLLFTCVLNFTGNAQTYKITSTALKDYYITKYFTWDQVDEETFFLTAQVQQKSIVYLMNFKVVYDAETDVYTAEKLDVSHNQVYKNLQSRFFKFNGEIYRLRIDRKKDGTSFYADRFTGSQFLLSESPFHTTTEKFTNTRVLTGAHSFYITSTPDYGEVQKYVAEEFDADFKVLSSAHYKVPMELKARYKGFLLHENKLMLSYSYVEKDHSRLGFVFWGDLETKTMEYDNELGKLVDYSIWSSKGKLFCFILNHEGNNLGNKLLQLDVENQSVQKVDENDLFYTMKSFSEMKNFYVKEDANGDVYLCYVLPGGPKFSTGDLLVMKLSQGEIAWTTAIKRSDRVSESIFLPDVRITEKTIELYDAEPSTKFDAQGQYLPDLPEKKIQLKVDYVPVLIELLKQDGALTRTLKAKV